MKKHSRITAVILIVAIQVALFGFTWDYIVDYAADLGRAQRGGVSFGITVYYGSIIAAFMFILSTGATALLRGLRARLIMIAVLLALWCVWLVPSFSSYPIRGLSFCILGILVTVIGSVLVTPVVVRVLGNVPKNLSEQDVALDG